MSSPSTESVSAKKEYKVPILDALREPIETASAASEITRGVALAGACCLGVENAWQTLTAKLGLNEYRQQSPVLQTHGYGFVLAIELCIVAVLALLYWRVYQGKGIISAGVIIMYGIFDFWRTGEGFIEFVMGRETNASSIAKSLAAIPLLLIVAQIHCAVLGLRACLFLKRTASGETTA